jgi:hypothetical protein
MIIKINGEFIYIVNLLEKPYKMKLVCDVNWVVMNSFIYTNSDNKKFGIFYGYPNIQAINFQTSTCK